MANYQRGAGFGSQAGMGFGAGREIPVFLRLDARTLNIWTHELWRDAKYLDRFGRVKFNEAPEDLVLGRDHLPILSADGRRYLAYREKFPNIVVTTGLNKLLDATLKTGLASPAWYVGLVDNASFSAYAGADTMASHGGWLEGTPYSNANRPTFTPGSVSAGSVDNSASKAAFTINATLTVRGSFLTDNNTKGGTTGTLYGEGDYAASRAVVSGDTLNVQITASVS